MKREKRMTKRQKKTGKAFIAAMLTEARRTYTNAMWKRTQTTRTGPRSAASPESPPA